MPSLFNRSPLALKIIGAIGATCAYPFAGDELFGQTTEHHHPPSAAPVLPAKQSFFSDADFKTISRIATSSSLKPIHQERPAPASRSISIT